MYFGHTWPCYSENPLCRDHSGYGLSQWENTLQCNVVSYYLSLYPERSLQILRIYIYVCAPLFPHPYSQGSVSRTVHELIIQILLLLFIRWCLEFAHATTAPLPRHVQRSWLDHWSQNYMMTSTNGNIFNVTGPLCGEFTGPGDIPLTKASDAELWCFLWSVPE